MSKTKEEILAEVKAGDLDIEEAGRLLSELETPGGARSTAR